MALKTHLPQAEHEPVCLFTILFNAGVKGLGILKDCWKTTTRNLIYKKKRKKRNRIKIWKWAETVQLEL